jgi:hypothetical protein
MASTASQPLAAIFEALANGIELTPPQLLALSDLDRDEAAELRRLWPAIDAEIRATLLAGATELTIDDVALHFEELGKVALNDADSAVRALAVGLLWESEDPAVGGVFLSMLDADPDIEVRIAAAAGLRPFVLLREFEQIESDKGNRIVEGLLAVAADESEPPELRAVAVESLGPRSVEEVAGVIREAYDHDDPRMQLAAIRAMGSSTDERWLDYVIDRMESPDPDFRIEAAIAAGAIGSEDALDGLALLLEDDEDEVIAAAIEAMGEIGGQEAKRMLEELAEVAPEELQEAILAALEEVNEFAQGMGARR